MNCFLARDSKTDARARPTGNAAQIQRQHTGIDAIAPKATADEAAQHRVIRATVDLTYTVRSAVPASSTRKSGAAWKHVYR